MAFHGNNDGSNFGKKPAKKKLRALPMQRHNTISASAYLALREKAYYFKLKRKIEVATMNVVDMLVHLQALTGTAAVNATELNERVKRTNEVSEPTARDQIKRAVDEKVISEEKSGVYVEYFFTPQQASLVREVHDLLDKCLEVVMLQRANSQDENAGRGLVPDEVYHNVISDNIGKKEK